ncbi:MAG: helix-turn-helix transcriptional regulator [Xanthomonadales bacterium]|nr:helix-turn-helix transcriptional regulator [Xanthomonadales bacterium]
MADALTKFKARAFARPGVKQAYEELAEEFLFLDEVLKARADSGLTQAEVAARAGTTQSAIARLESAESKHSPTIATLQKYARALGYTVEIRLVKTQRALKSRSASRVSSASPARRPTASATRSAK